jgi:hypothetical protein
MLGLIVHSESRSTPKRHSTDCEAGSYGRWSCRFGLAERFRQGSFAV